MRRFGRDTLGQSLVETALVLPLLLLLVLGIADLGRLGYYSIAVSQATRNAAAYAAVNPAPTPSELLDLRTKLQTRVCDELRLGVGCVDLPTVSSTLNPKVSVTYRFTLITAVIAQRFGAGSIPLTAEATFPGYTQ